jgi:hypothetical protein
MTIHTALYVARALSFLTVGGLSGALLQHADDQRSLRYWRGEAAQAQGIIRCTTDGSLALSNFVVENRAALVALYAANKEIRCPDNHDRTF